MTPHLSCDMIVELNTYGVVKISGPDAKKFLQGQLTCHLDEVTPESTRLCAHCNPQGRIISFSRILEWDNAYYLQMERNMAPIAIHALKKYAVFFKVEITNVSDELTAIGYQPLTINNLSAYLPTLPNETNDSIAHQDFIVVKIQSQYPRYLIMGKNIAIQSLLKTPDLPIHLKSYENWKFQDIHVGLPTIYPETSGKFLPHEIGLQHLNAFSLSKGCYTGQEIIARMHYRGKLKTKVYRAAIRYNEAPMPGSDIYSIQPTGKMQSGSLIDISQEGYHNYVALIITDENNAMNDHLFLESDESTFFTILN